MTPTHTATRLTTPWEAFTSTATDLAVSERLHGFGGLHGGIAVAIAAHRLQLAAGDATPLRSLHARFTRPIRDALQVTEPRHRAGRLVDVATVGLETRGKPAVSVEATFARSSMAATSFARSMPVAGEPDDAAEFAMPVEFVPFAEFIEIRPTTPDRPFASSPSPALQAWIRLRDDEPVDLLRLLVLFDALAPSAAATLSEFVAIPTVELTVRPSLALAGASSPWILLDASSVVSDDGWVHETLEAWSPTGHHLGTATQLRLMAPRTTGGGTDSLAAPD